MNLNSFQNDYNFGKAAELESLPIIIKYFNDDSIYHTPQQFHPFDFIGTNEVFDIKTRRKTYNAYPTTLLKSYHINKKPTNKDLIFLFKFTDGLYYIKYDTELFKTFDNQNIVRGERNGIIDVKEIHIMIPINLLIRIC